LHDFKQINDAHGHLAGDEALKHVATVLHSPLRRSSTICRFGGDEFCILVPECSAEEAQLVGERLKSEIEAQPLILEGVGSVQVRVVRRRRHPDSRLTPRDGICSTLPTGS